MERIQKAKERVYKRSYLYQQIWYRFCVLCAIKDTVHKRNKRAVSIGLAMASVYLLDSAIGVGLVDSALVFFNQPNDLVRYTTLYIHSVLKWMAMTLEWFMNAPVGLKLNNQLTEFLCKMFLDLLSLWSFFYSVILVEYLHIFFHCLLYAKFLGITIVLSVALHFFKFLNFWLIWFYVFCRLIMRLHVAVLLSLFRLFTVRKWNPLRKRVDSCTYDPKQLLLGTLFFISLLFLLPTTSVFYLLFLVLNTVHFLVSSIVRFSIVFVNRLILYLIRKILKLYEKPEICTLTFEVSNQSESSEAIVVTGVWNETRYNLNKICDLVNQFEDSQHHEQNNYFGVIGSLSMNKWFDIDAF